MMFQIICKQIFLNLFVAIIIDAFLGNAEMFSLPIQVYEINEYTLLWSKYDAEATGFMAISDLENFLLDMAKSPEGKGIIVLHELLIKDENHRKRFIGKL